jgi:hypothetical protein
MSTKIFLILASLSLIVANSAFWFTRNIFDPNKFSDTATSAILSESSREAMASEITGKILQNRPIVLNVADEPVTKMISGFLGSNLVTQIIDRTITGFQKIITTKRPDPVEINLVPVKDKLAKISSITDQPLPVTDREVPDNIVLAAPEKLPNIYQMGVTLTWVGPIALLLSIFFLVFPIYKSWQDKRKLKKLLAWESVAVLVSFIVSLLLGPIFKPPVLANFTNDNVRQLVSNIYDAFINVFNSQTWLLFGVSFGIFIWFLFLNQSQKRKTGEII